MPPKSNPRKRLNLPRVPIKAVAWVLTALAMLQPAAYLGARSSWILDAATHLTVPGVILLGASASLWLYQRRWLLGLYCLCFAAFQVMPLFQFDSPSTVVADPNSKDRLRILVANVLNNNSRFQVFADFVRKEDPDIVGLVEYSKPWVDALEKDGLRAKYPYRVEFPAGGRGIAVWSRIKPHRMEPAQWFTPRGNPVMKMTLPIGENLTTIWIVHPPNPIGPLKDWATLDLMALAEQVGLRGGSQIVLGDLNRTEGSPYYQDFLDQSRLRDSRMGFGRQPTWPAGFPIQIPLDHAFLSDDLAVIDRRIGPNIGSDHLPLIIDVAPAVNSRK